MGSSMTSGAGKPADEVAPCAPLGKGLASFGAPVPDGVVGVGGGGAGGAL